jgi:hypothetical protein
MKNNNSNLISFVKKKLSLYKNIIQNSLLHIQKNKINDIISLSEVSIAINKLSDISNSILEIEQSLICNSTKDSILKNLQNINNDLSALFKEFGTYNFEELIIVCLGENKICITPSLESKFDLIKKYFHPISYKITNSKNDIYIKNKDNKIINFSDDSKKSELECKDILSEFKQFYVRTYGMKINLMCEENKLITVFGIVDEVFINILNNNYLSTIKKLVINNIPDQSEFQSANFNDFIESLSLKDYLILEDYTSIYNKYYGYISFNDNIKQKHISNIVKDFTKEDLYGKRTTIIMLLLNNELVENEYLAYLLYDILSSDMNGTIDTNEQIILFDSFPLIIKNNFKQAMKKTIQYTNDLCNYDANRIPLEQQICLMNVSNNVKEKAMIKLKEVKTKSEDSGIKARQYIEGLLKIPFNIFKKEPILTKMNEIKISIRKLIQNNEVLKEINDTNLEIETTMDVINFINNSKKYFSDKIDIISVKKYIESISKYKKLLSEVLELINDFLEKNNFNNLIKKVPIKKKDLLQNLNSI